MKSRERVIRAIEFKEPDQIPIWILNTDTEQGDILWYDFRIQSGGNVVSFHGGDLSEWGFKWKRLNDGTMGQADPVLRDWSDLKNFKVPELKPEVRLKDLAAFKKRAKDYFQLAMPIVTGNELYILMRGFENAMMDYAEENENMFFVLDSIMQFEKDLMTLAAKNGFDGFYFGDDWGTQQDLMISPDLWRKIFKDRYKDQFAHAHNLGLYTIFHSCGNITKIIPELHEIGLDVMYISQPKAVDISAISKQLKGKQCFMPSIDYQRVSIPGKIEDIYQEGKMLRQMLGTEKGGLIGYVEDYSCLGMSKENFDACKAAFNV